MNSVVLDASALLAAMLQEPGAERVAERLSASIMSAVNLSEVAGRAVLGGYRLEDVVGELSRLPITIMPFDTEQAYLAASLGVATRSLGLSLGDRACLALGLKLDLPVLTADQIWATVDLGVKVELIRTRRL